MSDDKELKKQLGKVHQELRTHKGVLQGRRVEYFRGKRVINELLKEENMKVFDLKNKSDADSFLGSLLRNETILKVEKIPKARKKGMLKILPPFGGFDGDSFYCWSFNPSARSPLWMLLVCVCVVLACLFPVWPIAVRVGLWYISVTLLIALTGFVVLRLGIFLTLWCFGYAFWILPNVFDDKRTVIESFKPLFSFEKSTIHWLFRVTLLLIIGGSLYWLASRPTEFERIMDAQKDFIESLYAGTLLSDFSQQSKDTIDEVHMPSLDEIMKDFEDEDADMMDEAIEQAMENMVDDEFEDEENENDNSDENDDDDDEIIIYEEDEEYLAQFRNQKEEIFVVRGENEPRQPSQTEAEYFGDDDEEEDDDLPQDYDHYVDGEYVQPEEQI
eukprot:TRINITY_DN277_c0_g4_i1.p1 TRINITY_DN277_c0_g4~~TRINITY_DN277_c0_g4_i1.p1  ORF type:complete len:387 (-),score=132.61 TRINITY_DN277_c0_g4_i1:130-1290(-)